MSIDKNSDIENHLASPNNIDYFLSSEESFILSNLKIHHDNERKKDDISFLEDISFTDLHLDIKKLDDEKKFNSLCSLVEKIVYQKNPDISSKKIHIVIKKFFELLTVAIISGDVVEIRGIGSFKINNKNRSNNGIITYKNSKKIFQNIKNSKINKINREKF